MECRDSTVRDLTCRQTTACPTLLFSQRIHRVILKICLSLLASRTEQFRQRFQSLANTGNIINKCSSTLPLLPKASWILSMFSSSVEAHHSWEPLPPLWAAHQPCSSTQHSSSSTSSRSSYQLTETTPARCSQPTAGRSSKVPGFPCRKSKPTPTPCCSRVCSGAGWRLQL